MACKPRYEGDEHLNNIEAYSQLTPTSKKNFEKALEHVLVKWYKKKEGTATKNLNRFESVSKAGHGKESHRRTSSFMKDFLPFFLFDSYVVFKRHQGKIVDEALHENIRKVFNSDNFSRKARSISVKKRRNNISAENPPPHSLKAIIFPSTALETVLTDKLQERFEKMDKRIDPVKTQILALEKRGHDHKWVRKWELKKMKELGLKKEPRRPRF